MLSWLTADVEPLIRRRPARRPFAVLGPCRRRPGTLLRAFLPGACSQRDRRSRRRRRAGALLNRRDGLFEGALAARGTTACAMRWPTAANRCSTTVPLRPGARRDGRLAAGRRGTHLRPFRDPGRAPRTVDGVGPRRFAVWAPNARASASSATSTSGTAGATRCGCAANAACGRSSCPGGRRGELYKFEIARARRRTAAARPTPTRARAELRPATASVVGTLPRLPRSWIAPRERALDAPISIYEVHLGSWRRPAGDHWLDWDELADTGALCGEMGFTHLELLPVIEHPFDGSWGYQPIGLFAPTALRRSPPASHFVDRARAGIGVILDWVPAHFPTDAHGLARFDGTRLYEHTPTRAKASTRTGTR